MKDDLPWDDDISSFQLVLLNPNEEDYKIVFESFKKTLPNNTINTIKRIQNSELYKSYQESMNKSKRLKEINGQKLIGNENYERHLWHGTKTTDPMELVDRTTSGLSTQYANDACMWGRGIYFAENASYSFNYSFSKNGFKYMLFCKVFVGEFIFLNANSNLKEPPYKDQKKKILYDSVQGNTNGSDVYILYENNRNYPYFLVEFK